MALPQASVVQAGFEQPLFRKRIRNKPPAPPPPHRPRHAALALRPQPGGAAGAEGRFRTTPNRATPRTYRPLRPAGPTSRRMKPPGLGWGAAAVPAAGGHQAASLIFSYFFI